MTILSLLLLQGSWSFHSNQWPARAAYTRARDNMLSIESPLYVTGGMRHSARKGLERNIICRSASSQASLPSGANSSSSGSSKEEASPQTQKQNATETGRPPPVIPERVLAEVRELRARAQQLKAEALAEEAALKGARSNLRDQRLQECDSLVERLFHNERNSKTGVDIENNSTIATKKVADILRKEQWSPQQVVMVLERLQERLNGLVGMQPPTTILPMGNNRMQNSNATEELMVLDVQISSLIQAAGTLDDEYESKVNTKKINTTTDDTINTDNTLVSSRWTGRVEAALRTRRKEMMRAYEEDMKRQLAVSITKNKNNKNNNMNTVVTTTSPDKQTPDAIMWDEIQENIERITKGKIPSMQGNGGNNNNNNSTSSLGRVSSVPFWVPPSLLPFLAESRATIRKEDVALIKDRVLSGTKFFCTSSDSIPSAAIFRGNLRTPPVDATEGPKEKSRRSNHTATVLEEIQQRLEAEGMAERIQLFLMDDPEWRPGSRNVDHITRPLPVILAISKKVKPTENAMEKATTSTFAKVISFFFCSRLRTKHISHTD